MFGNQIKGGFGMAVIIAVIVWIFVFAVLLNSPTELGKSLRRGWGDSRRASFTSDSSSSGRDTSREEEEVPSPLDIEEDSPDPEFPDLPPLDPPSVPDSTPSPLHSPSNTPGDSPSLPGDTPSQPGILPPDKTSPSRNTPPGDSDDDETNPEREPLHQPDGNRVTPPNLDDPLTQEKKKIMCVPGWMTIFIPEEKPTARAKNPVNPGSATVPKPDGPVPVEKEDS